MNRQRKQRLLLIGASGRVGRLLNAAWSLAPPENFDVLAQYRRPSEKMLHESVIWDPLHEPFPSCGPVVKPGDVMVVMAGVTPGSVQALDDNAGIALGCIQAARELGIRRVLVSSTSAVYGPGTGRPLRESDKPERENHYGASKIAMEAAVQNAAADMEVCCLRIGNVLGADALLLNAVSATQENPLVLDQFDSGNGPVRSYVDPQTLADIIVALVQYPFRLPTVLNVAAPQPVAMQTIAEEAGIPWRWRSAREGAIERIVLDCERLASIYRFAITDHEPHSMLERLKKVGALL